VKDHKASIRTEALTGAALVAAIPDLARLRMAVFRDWPYLYDGDEAYEATYLAKFTRAMGAVCIAAYDGDVIVGASTGCPLVESDAEFIEPFRTAGWDISKIFYCGESVLLSSYRGHGLGHAFFDGREAQAHALGGFTNSTFCRVIRPDDHPLKPAGYRPLDGFWKKRGYAPIDLYATVAWKDIDQPAETDKPLQFWIKAL